MDLTEAEFGALYNNLIEGDSQIKQYIQDLE